MFWPSPVRPWLQPLRQLSTNLADPFGDLPPQLARRVVVTGLGLVTPLGVGVATVWERLLAGASGVRKLEAADLPEAHRLVLPQLPCQVVACVPQDELAAVPWAAQEDPRRTARFMSYALTAAAEALQDSGWHPETAEQRRATGVAIGAGMSSTADMAEAGVLLAEGKLRRLSPYFVPKTLVNMAAGAVSIKYGLQGPNHAVATACATGAHALGDAFSMIRRGDADVMLAGGTESCVDAVALAGFSRLKALSTQFNDDPAAASRPFDARRDGFVMGEGAGVVVMEELGHAMRRGATVYGEVRGYGMSGDAHHITQPPADGGGAQLAMLRALARAGLAAEQICYINAHATSTPQGDDIEQRAIAAVFGADSLPAVSSTKGATGHLLGAAGAVEAIFSLLALRYGIAPPTVNLTSPDPALLAGLVAGTPRRLPTGPRAVLSNSFGFGGTNAALVFATAPCV
ncbi:hypothetical protein D9Q98_002168 [Chlorella vulgaris]|uniref:3-oxoacyl-[acyl-carrier-protein] synthase n=1 Tax=Chlorella vulgaris TaxID=3077 RepID=A0A9D4Z0F0_CHLVU|nr:hypothetical protein D9Q98_002168 [Chlorella vulgaris]